MGRRPKADAIRRQHTEATFIEPATVQVPAVVEGNDLMLECWTWITSGTSHFTLADTPQLVALSYWWAVQQQCIANLVAANGGVRTKVSTPMGDRQDPDVRTMQLATNQVRTLSAELGISPLARARMGLMKMATVSMAADLPERVFKMLDEHYGD